MFGYQRSDRLLYQIDQEYLDEYINIKKLELGDEIVEHLSDMKEETTDTYTKKYLQQFIDDSADEYKVCKSCYEQLEPIVVDETHGELDGHWVEKVVIGWECNCGNKYFY